MGIPEIVAEVRSHRGARHVVLTGGEPMIAAGIRELAQALKAGGYHLTIETAATIAPEGIPFDLASLSPKLLNSAPDGAKHGVWRKRHESTRWKPEIVRAWLDSGRDYQLKFVVSAPSDVQELEGMLATVGREIPPERIFLMPEGTSLEILRRRAEWLVDACKQRGYRYAHRLHIELFGNRRGV